MLSKQQIARIKYNTEIRTAKEIYEFHTGCNIYTPESGQFVITRLPQLDEEDEWTKDLVKSFQWLLRQELRYRYEHECPFDEWHEFNECEDTARVNIYCNRRDEWVDERMHTIGALHSDNYIIQDSPIDSILTAA